MPSFSDTFENAIHTALGLANARKHEFASLEHLLLALVDEPDAARVMQASNVDLGSLRQSLLEFLDDDLSTLISDASDVDAVPTGAFQRVVQRAAIHTQSSGREEVTGADVLTAIFAERDSNAAYFLNEQDMTRYDAVNFIAHGVAKNPNFGFSPEKSAIREQKKKARGGSDKERDFIQNSIQENDESIKFTTTLEKSIHKALALANERKQEFATTEHLLLALIDEPDASDVMYACDVNLDLLRENLLDFLNNDLFTQRSKLEGTEAVPTGAFQRIIQRAAIHVRSSGQKTVTGANLIVATFAERESKAAELLQEQNMSRYDAVNFVAHGIVKQARKDIDSGVVEEEDSVVSRSVFDGVEYEEPLAEPELVSRVWLVQYRHENGRAFEQDMHPGVVKSWKVAPYAPDRVTREARDGDLVVIWRTLDRQSPENRPKSDGGIVGWGRLRLSGRPETSPTIRFEVTHAFPDRPINRSDVHKALGLDKAEAARWPGMVSLRRLIGAEAAAIASFRPPEAVINRSDHPLASGIPPDWASGWGEDEHGVFVEITVGDVTQALRWCPPGRFLMGSPEDEALRDDNEGPQIEITFEQGFWLFDTPVTEALYEAVTGDTPPAALGGPDLPVRRILHSSAEQFIKRINAIRPGLELRLPSEAEWEYACRAGSITPFELTVARAYSGTSITPTEVNYDANEPYAEVPKCNVSVEVVDVKGRTFRPNAWGLWQMHGNVCELCADVWHDSHVGASADGKARQAVARVDEKRRAIRGGSWLSPASLSRSARRFGQQQASLHIPDTGFRPARSQVSGAQAGREKNAERSMERGKTELRAERARGAVQAAIRNWLSDRNDGRREIQSAITGQIEAISPDVEANATSGSVELSPWAPELRSIDWPEDERITVSEVAAANGNTVEAVFNVPATLLLNLSIEMNFSHWDSVDKEELSMGGRTEEVEREEDVVVTCTVQISDAGGEDEYVELIEAEIDLKVLFVDLGEVDVFLPEDRDYDHEETRDDAEAERSRGNAALGLGRFEEAEARFRQAVAIYKLQDDRSGMAECLRQLGGISQRRGDPQQAEARYHKALEHYQLVGDRASTAEVLRQLAGISKSTRNLQKAEALFAQALATYESEGDRSGMVECLRQLSEIEKLLGNSEQAERWLSRSFEIKKSEPGSSK